MRTTAKRIFEGILLAGFATLAAGQSVHSTPVRPATPRPSASRSVRVGKLEYVPVAELERRFDLRGSWLKKDEQLLLKNDRWRLELNVDSREVEINGLRLLLGEPCRAQNKTVYLSKVDAERVVGPILRPGYLQPGVPELRTIVIDPGHGGVDNGTQNKRLGLTEKTLAFDVAARLGKLLRSEGFKVVFTRDTDTKVELQLRAATANMARADLFISLHFNSLPNDTKTNGTEIFTFAPADVRSTDAWSANVNDAEGEASPVNKYDHWSAVLAYAMQRELLGVLKTYDRGKKLAHFGVLRSLNCPGVLIESGFLSNDTEARKISTPKYREQIAEAIAGGVHSYAATLEALRRSAAASDRAHN